MREIFKRIITGVVYVILLLSVVFLNSDAFDFLFMVFGLICLYEFKHIIGLKGYHIFVVYLVLWWAYIYLIEDNILIYLLLGTIIIIDIFLLAYLFSKKKKTFTKFQKILLGLFYIGGGCIFLTMIPYQSNQFAEVLIMGVFILIWVNDSFAYLVGKSMGKTKLYPAVSPKKTIEGSLGGLVFALITAVILAQYETTLNTIQWLILAAVIVITGSLGDLVQSKFKRVVGVKDSGAILPGHGGMWDRLDSLVFAAPFAYLTLNIFTYVS
ncbi:MAG: phosphatidate cytidylyltransferase [Cellulophaga sp.]